MFAGMSYEELNKRIKNPRSEPYETYFGDMDLTKEEQKKRISLAKKLDNNFLPILILLFTFQQYNQTINWEEIRMRFELGYRNSLRGVMTIDAYLDTYIKTFSYDVIDSTQRHADDFYYYSIDRATLIAESESQTDWNYDEFQQAIKSGNTMKQWVDVRDRRERESHRKVGGTIKPIRELFLVGNSLMRYPKDMEYSPDLSQVANCRCTIKYF